MDITHYDITVDRQAITNVKLLEDLLGLLRPNWNVERVQLEDLSRRGFVNVNIICRHEDDAVFVRISNEANVSIYNEELKQARKFVSKRGFSARLLCTFNNGFVEECLEGEPITWQTKHRVHDEEIKRGIAAEMARYHTRDVLEEAQSVGILPGVPFLRNSNMDYVWQEVKKCGKIEMSVVDCLPGRETFMAERNALNAMLDKLGAEKAFCHFDVNPANVFVLESGRVIFTDYETTCISYAAVDVGYYFLLVDYEFGKGPLDTYPKEAFRREFCRMYLNEKRKIANDNSLVHDKDLDRFERQVEVGMLMALLLFIMCNYIFLTDMLNTPIPAERVITAIQHLWPSYNTAKETIMHKYNL